MDFPYIILIFILLIFLIKSWNGNRRQKYFYYSSVLTFAFVAFRACVVGADTYNYTLGFLRKADYYWDVEPLYKLYQNVLSGIWKNEVFFIFTNTILSLAPIYYLVKRESSNAILSIFAFFIFQIYLPYFVALRQILGIALLLLGVIAVINNKKRRWFLYGAFACCAYFMHNSTIINSILFFILYFVPLNNRRTALVIILTTAAIGIVSQNLKLSELFNMYLNMNIGLTTDRLNAYVQDDQLNDASNAVNMIWLLRYSIVGVFVFYFIDESKLNHWFTKIYLLSVVISNIFFNVDMITRMNLAFNLFSIITFTWGFSERYQKYIREHEYFKFIGPCLILFFLQSYVRSQIGYDLNDSSRMHPYYFFWEDYHTHPSITRF